MCSGTVCYTFENAPQTFTHGAKSNLAQCSVVSTGGCPEVLRRPSRTQTDSMHVKLRLLLNAHGIYIGYAQAKKTSTDFRNGAIGDQEYAFASFRKCTKPDSPLQAIAPFRKTVTQNTVSHHFPNVWNTVLGFTSLDDFGNRLTGRLRVWD